MQLQMLMIHRHHHRHHHSVVVGCVAAGPLVESRMEAADLCIITYCSMNEKEIEQRGKKGSERKCRY